MPPTMLLNSLAGVRRKVKVLSVVYGLGLVLVCAVALVLATVALDYLLNLPAGPRVVVIAGSIAAIAYGLYRFVIKPLLARLTLGDVAGRLEHTFPQFDDRLRSTVDFVDADHVPGSEAMKQRVVDEATKLAEQVNLQSAIARRPAVTAASGGLVALILVVILWSVASPLIRDIVRSRLLTPFNAKPWPKKVQIDLVSNVPQRVPVGQRVDVRIKLAKGDRASMKPVILYQYGNGAVQQEYMTRADDGTYAASLDAKVPAGADSGQLSVWMKAGDDEKKIAPVTVVPRLAINKVEAVVTPPAYAGLGPSTVNLSSNPAVMAMGSQVELRIGFNKALAAGSQVVLETVTPDMKRPDIAWNTPDAFTSAGRWIAVDSLRFHVKATDIDGFTNNALEEFELIVKPDQNPTVQIENPRRNEERTPDAVVPLQGVAEDDYGISSVKLIVDRLKDKKHWEIDLIAEAKPVSGVAWGAIDASGDRQRHRLNFPWELKQLKDANLQPGDVLEYHLLAQDNFELGGSRHAAVPSGKLRIAIITQEEFANRIADELRTIAQNVNQIRSGQVRTRQETGTLKQETEQKKELDSADRAAAERLANQQSTAASQSKQIASKLESIGQRMEENRSPNTELKQIASDVRDVMNNAAEHPMKDAANQINTAARDPKQSPESRNENFDKATGNQDQAAEQLQKALDRMGNIGSLSSTIDRIKALLAEQKKTSKETSDIGKNNLGKTPDQMSPEERKKLEQNAEEQKKLAEKTDRALEEMKKLGESMAKSDPSTAEAMKQAAQTGQQQQVSPNQSKASQAAKQNQQSQAQAAQKQAEIGLEMMLNDLREAERRKLEELARKLDEMQQQLARLIRRQAGHNLDNLSLQGPEVLSKVETKILEDLLTKSERTKDAMPPVPEIGQLNAAQEQTERNTRDLSKSAEELPGGAEPSALLTKAAGKMERAIVSLRETKLKDAYEPPQVEALAALVEAGKIIDEQKKKIDEKLAEQQKEAIRLVYVKIKEDQEKLNGETTKIDKSPRTAEGTYNRVDAVRLGQLPGEQGKLADRTSALDERLAALNSVVYVWANKDIVGSMNGVKGDLAKPLTGVAVQAEQTRVVEQLDAMIKSLATKPQEKKFEARGGGGGGGGGRTPMPSEAELRLLKELQGAVNKSTKTIDAQPERDKEKDKPKLVALGDRQGAMRDLLDQTFQKASRGEMKLGPEPDNRDQLPEEAGAEKIENQELEKQLLTDEPTVEQVNKDINLIGDRMARARQRLAINNDPGKTTQLIQERIQQNMDELIEMARAQQAQSKGQPQKNAQKQNQPKPGEANPANQEANGKQQGQSQPNRGSTPANASNPPGSADTTADLSQDIHQKMTEWGGVTKRQRDAILESAGETVVEKYRKLASDYYQTLATKETERK